MLSSPSSVSPPISPLTLALSRTVSKPAIPINLGHLPTWHRPSFDKHVRNKSITLNAKNIDVKFVGKVEHASQYTQTSPLSASGSLCSSSSSDYTENIGDENLISRRHARKVMKKKIAFLQSNYKLTLSKLHSEVERLKLENQELKFNLVFSSNKLALPEFASFHGETQNHSNEPSEHVVWSDGQNAGSSCKVECRLGGTELNAEGNPIFNLDANCLTRIRCGRLSSSVNAPEIRSSSRGDEISAFAEAPSVLPTMGMPDAVSETHPRVSLASPVHVTEDRGDGAIPQNMPGVSKQSREERYISTIRQLRMITSKQSQELLLLKDKIQKQATRETGASFLPRIEPLKLRSHRSDVARAKRLQRNTKELILPALCPPPASKLSDRQKKARLLHVQRQRSNQNMHLASLVSNIKF